MAYWTRYELPYRGFNRRQRPSQKNHPSNSQSRVGEAIYALYVQGQLPTFINEYMCIGSFPNVQPPPLRNQIHPFKSFSFVVIWNARLIHMVLVSLGRKAYPSCIADAESASHLQYCKDGILCFFSLRFFTYVPVT